MYFRQLLNSNRTLAHRITTANSGMNPSVPAWASDRDLVLDKCDQRLRPTLTVRDINGHEAHCMTRVSLRYTALSIALLIEPHPRPHNQCREPWPRVKYPSISTYA